MGMSMEIYLTIEGLAEYLKLAEQTIRRWVLNREIPFCKIKKVIRFRVSEIEKWIDNGGACMPLNQCEDSESGLFVEPEVQELIKGVGETEGGI